MEGLLRCISVNTEHRSKYPNDPSKFQESELSLAESIHQLQDLLTSDPSPDTCIACIDPLVQLLGHDNLDIAGAAIQAIEQLVQTQQQLEAVVQEVVNKGAVHLLVENLSRLGQQVDDDDLDTFDRTLNVLEIIVDIVPMVADVLVAETSVCEILIRKIEEEEEEEEEDGVFDELQLYVYLL
jgi:beta-catenin-like protein 1